MVRWSLSPKGFRQPRSGAREPGVYQRLPQVLVGNDLKLDENRRKPLKMGDREERGRGGGKDGLLFTEIRDSNREDRSIGRSGCAEALEVRFAESSLLGERLPADEPGQVALELALTNLGQLHDHARDILDGGHMATIAPRPPSTLWAAREIVAELRSGRPRVTRGSG